MVRLWPTLDIFLVQYVQHRVPLLALSDEQIVRMHTVLRTRVAINK